MALAIRQEEVVEDVEVEGGACPFCGTPARLMTCWECCDSAWVIECVHRAHPRPLQRGRADGTDRHRIFCGECAETLTEEAQIG
jgi:hypothetical protein